MKVFINGGAGTTGLKIESRLNRRQEAGQLKLLTLPDELRKSAKAAAEISNSADAVFLCLPDDAAREAASLITSADTVVIDASTAHRTNPEWTYGFPELSPDGRERIAASKRIAVPGCYASGFAALVAPLVRAGIIPRDYPVTSVGISGYSGAGKKGIAQYEDSLRDKSLDSARLYALSQNHKHIPEMQYHCGLSYPPQFQPVIDDFYSGMIVTVPIITRLLPRKTIRADIYAALSAHYDTADSHVHVKTLSDADSTDFLAANAFADRSPADSDDMELFVFGNDDTVMLAARLDNLGKGASGAAVQCFDIVMSNKK